MKIKYQNILIREANIDDVKILYNWWRDGNIMAHAGFPDGLDITIEEIKKQIINNQDSLRHMILFDDQYIGEMVYYLIDDDTCEIGIKICDCNYQNKGLGKIILSLFIQELFTIGYQKIILDTSIDNNRALHVYQQLGFKKIKEELETVYLELIKDNFVSYVTNNSAGKSK